MPWIPLAIAAVSAGASIYQTIKKNKIDKANKRAELTTPEPYIRNDKLATSQAQYGLNPDALQSLKTGAEEGLTASLDTSLAEGGTPNTASDLFMNYISTLGKISVTDSQIKDQKIRDLYGMNTTLGDFDVTKFLYNKDAPFKDLQQRSNALGESAFKNFSTAVDTAGAGLEGYYTQNQNDEFMKWLQSTYS